MKAEAWRLWLLPLGLSLYVAVPRPGLVSASPDVAVATMRGELYGRTTMAEDDESGSDDSGSDEGGGAGGEGGGDGGGEDESD